MTTQILLGSSSDAERKILLLRGERIMLDEDLAVLYGVETRSLVRAVKRNLSRFPADFMFQLTADEVARLRSQTGISSVAHGGRRYPPLRLRRARGRYAARKLAVLEKKYDAQFRVVFDAIRELMAPSSKQHRPIGFKGRAADDR